MTSGGNFQSETRIKTVTIFYYFRRKSDNKNNVVYCLSLNSINCTNNNNAKKKSKTKYSYIDIDTYNTLK